MELEFSASFAEVNNLPLRQSAPNKFNKVSSNLKKPVAPEIIVNPENT